MLVLQIYCSQKERAVSDLPGTTITNQLPPRFLPLPSFVRPRSSDSPPLPPLEVVGPDARSSCLGRIGGGAIPVIADLRRYSAIETRLGV